MRPERVEKVRVIGLQQDKEKFIRSIHRLGCLHISDISRKSEVYNHLVPDVPLQEVERISSLLLRVNFLATVLNEVGVRPPNRIKVPETLVEAADEAEDELDSFESKITAKHHLLQRAIKERDERKMLLELAERFEVQIPDSEHVCVVYGRVLKKDVDKVKFKNDLIVGIKDESKDTYAILIVYHCRNEDSVSAMVREMGIEREKTALPNVAPAVLRKEIENLTGKIKKLRSDLGVMGEKHATTVGYLQQMLLIAKDRAEISNRFARSQDLFCMEAYIPVKKVRELERTFENTSLIVETQSVKEAPVLLKNPPYVKAYEHLTTMFGLPVYNGIDPTFFVSLFFPFFFGFMLSDVGYGLFVVLAAGAFAIFRKKQIFKDIATIALTCGISTIVFGFLFGSFFGNLIRIPALWVDPFKDAMTILTAAIIIGLIHANLGILLSMLHNSRERQWKKLIVENLSLILIQASIIAFIFNAPVLGGLLIAASAVLLIIKSSIFGVMEISGFLGLLLSYARLLALSLATGGIALAINIMAFELMNAGFVGFLFGPLLLVGGHVMNFVLNIIGSTVNATRLHFVEFFSLFFIEGGEKFVPFKIKQE